MRPLDILGLSKIIRSLSLKLRHLNIFPWRSNLGWYSLGVLAPPASTTRKQLYVSVDMVIEKKMITYQLVGYQMDGKSAAAVARCK